MSPIFLLLYTSKAAQPITEELVDGILRVSRQRNAAAGITGFLAIRHEHFLQLLEGSEDDVRATIGRIEKDSRHREIVVQGEAKGEKRFMADWTMALVGPTAKGGPAEEILRLFDMGRPEKGYSDPLSLKAMLAIFAKDAQLLR